MMFMPWLWDSRPKIRGDMSETKGKKLMVFWLRSTDATRSAEFTMYVFRLAVWRV